MRLLLALALLAPLPAQAACLTPERLYCQFTKGRALEVCAGTEMFTYTFGPEAKPDIELTVPFSAHPVQPWSGVGRDIWSALRVPNKDIVYEVWISSPRDPESETSAGINVLRGEQTIADLRCLPQTVEGDVTLFEDVMIDRGYCWNHGEHRWQKAGTCS